MSFRVTERSISDKVLFGLQGNLSKLGKYQEQLSSGKQITRPSDSPGGTLAAMQIRTDVRTTDQYARNADDGLAWLGTIDSALTTTVDRVHRARELVLTGMSSGAAGSPEAREAIAVEIDNIRESLISVANTKYMDRPVFGGNTNGSQAFNSSGVFVGDAGGKVTRSVGDNTKVDVNADGDVAFGTGPTQLFDVLKSISDNLRGLPTASGSLGADLDNLGGSETTILGHLSDVGARYNRLEFSKQAAVDRLITLKTGLAEIEDIDLPKTITDMQMQEASYQASLAAAAKIVRPSLVDFLR